MEWIGLYLLAASVLAFCLCGADKWKAKKHRYRIPEKTLFTVSALGGAWGFWIGMGVFRHKTKHRSFQILIPLFSVLWAALMGFLFWKRYLS